MKSLREIMTNPDRFLIGAELVSARGPIKPPEGGKIIDFVDGLASDARIDWISVTDNAGGNPMQAPYVLGKAVMERGKRAVIHIMCKDYNRNALEALAWMYSAEGLHNLLVLSGDYPIDGHDGLAQPVFDLDSVGLMKMLTDMNKGLQVKGRKPGTTSTLEQTEFFLGCTVSPFKLTEAEQMMQYQKFRSKVNAGAGFVVPQVGYDIRKSHELIEYMKEHDINLPVIGNIYKLGYGVAKVFNRGMIPGCVVTDELIARIEKERTADDKGKRYFTHLAAMQFAAFKKMGYHGGYVGGVERYSDFAAIIDAALEYEDTPLSELIDDLVYPRTGEFYYYGLDRKTGLSDTSRKNPILEDRARDRYRKNVSFSYRFSRFVHSIAFSENAWLHRFGKPLFTFLEKHSKLNRAAYFGERITKAAVFECKECGDCSLADIAYLCPQSQCQKNQRNGPCGGSKDGHCEFSACGKECIWVRAYDRERFFAEDMPTLLNGHPVVKDAALQGTSGWANYFLERDHFAKKNGDK